MKTPLKLIEIGYARLLNVQAEAFNKERPQIVKTAARERPAWAKWVMPIWIVRFRAAPVCSVSPRYFAVAKKIVENLEVDEILSPQLLEQARTLLNIEGRWQQREIMAYRKLPLPILQHGYYIEQLSRKSKGAKHLANLFDGKVFVIRNENEEIVSHAGIKNKGIIQEIAVKTDPDYQQQGMARAVVSEAMLAIIAKQNIPTYVPDTLNNSASYNLAYSLGFERVGEMIFWEYELPHWKGFVEDNIFNKIQKWVLAKVSHGRDLV